MNLIAKANRDLDILVLALIILLKIPMHNLMNFFGINSEDLLRKELFLVFIDNCLIIQF